MLTAAVMMKYIHGAGYTYMCTCICMFYFIVLSGTCVKYNDKKILFCVITFSLSFETKFDVAQSDCDFGVAMMMTLNS